MSTLKSRLSRSPTATRIPSAAKGGEMEILQDGTKEKRSEPRKDEGDVAATPLLVIETGSATETSETEKGDPWQDEEIENSPV
ncbi:hypothetical protein QE152_g10854 [Popillia japonica]|uniref:Uncharacterized protein n=1 Tax=Popillia japonica TaxID=7064 RepID=A0AAW1LUZ6_POPJA